MARLRASFSSFQYLGRRRKASNIVYFILGLKLFMTLSMTLMSLKSLMFWNVLAIPAWLRAMVFIPARSFSLSITTPLVGT